MILLLGINQLLLSQYTLKVLDAATKATLCLINLYANLSDSVRKKHWEELLEQQRTSTLDWVIWGDFNDLLWEAEKQGDHAAPLLDISQTCLPNLDSFDASGEGLKIQRAMRLLIRHGITISCEDPECILFFEGSRNAGGSFGSGVKKKGLMIGKRLYSFKDQLNQAYDGHGGIQDATIKQVEQQLAKAWKNEEL
ncbi:hypothetical protein Acr_03g0010730 [Actinidia rufa]|uniref:DNAse I-like superfamily protein n=1 Tax=Actinidia rufa TaxID=165716 RepID=A0A7J0EEL7_9ERIC|nr:hypothetical protein Acr_03g0010730 [Actinidia rufa]